MAVNVLYLTDINKNIHIWNIYVHDNIIYILSGIVDDNITSSIYGTYHSVKDVNKLYEDKILEGYKNISDFIGYRLDKKTQSIRLFDVSVNTKYNFFDKQGDIFYTPSVGIFGSPYVLVYPILDGVLCVCSIQNNKIIFQVIGNDIILKGFSSIKKEMMSIYNENEHSCIFIGYLKYKGIYHEKNKFIYEKIYNDKYLSKSDESYISFYIVDYTNLHQTRIMMTYSRYRNLLYLSDDKYKYVKYIDPAIVTGKANLYSSYKDVLDLGYTGIIIMKFNGVDLQTDITYSKQYYMETYKLTLVIKYFRRTVRSIIYRVEYFVPSDYKYKGYGKLDVETFKGYNVYGKYTDGILYTVDVFFIDDMIYYDSYNNVIDVLNTSYMIGKTVDIIFSSFTYTGVPRDSQILKIYINENDRNSSII